MPIYEFACNDCRTIFSFFARRVNTTATPSCPKCGKPLDRQVSLFRAARGSQPDADPLGLGDDGLDGDFPDIPDFDPGDSRAAAAIAEMGDRIDRIDPSNPAEAAGVLKEFSQKSGIRFNKGVADAIESLASGDTSEATQQRLAEAMEGGHLLEEIKKAGQAQASAPAPFAKDPTLYDLEPPPQ